MKLLYAEEFKRQFAKLPADAQRLYRRQEAILTMDRRDPRLHAKKLRGETDTYSFRVTSRYRVLFTISVLDTAHLITISHRKDAYRNL